MYVTLSGIAISFKLGQLAKACSFIVVIVFGRVIFSKLRHFQPQIGCLNCCSFCSKSSSPIIEYWNEKLQSIKHTIN
jgi:hypothetical protein